MRNPGNTEDVVLASATAADLAAVRELLAAADLPAGMDAHAGHFLVARLDGAVVGCIGMEVHGADALFRSFAVRRDQRGAGLGTRLFMGLLDAARARGIARVYLMTRTIQALAESWGFRVIARDSASTAIRAASQFHADECSSAVLMRLDLAGRRGAWARSGGEGSER